MDKIVSVIARVLESMFLLGAGLTIVVVVLTVIDIVRDIFKRDPRSSSEIDGIGRAA